MSPACAARPLAAACAIAASAATAYCAPSRSARLLLKASWQRINRRGRAALQRRGRNGNSRGIGRSGMSASRRPLSAAVAKPSKPRGNGPAVPWPCRRRQSHAMPPRKWRRSKRAAPSPSAYVAQRHRKRRMSCQRSSHRKRAHRGWAAILQQQASARMAAESQRMLGVAGSSRHGRRH